MVGGSVHWLSNFTVGLVFLYMEVRTNHRAKPCLKISLFTPYRKALRSCKCTHWFPEPVCWDCVKGNRLFISIFLSHLAAAQALKESSFFAG